MSDMYIEKKDNIIDKYGLQKRKLGKSMDERERNKILGTCME